MTESQAALSEQRRRGPGASADPAQRGNKWWTLVAAVIALTSGVISLAAICGKDFVHQRAAGGDQ